MATKREQINFDVQGDEKEQLKAISDYRGRLSFASIMREWITKEYNNLPKEFKTV